MALSQADWHQRFRIQAQWTEGLRLYFFNLIKEEDLTRVIDIGCGTGVLLPDLEVLSPARIVGADLNLSHLDLAKDNSQDSDLLGANVHQLPFLDDCFDIVLCHYFLMWVGDPRHALREMKRITRPGGTVVAFAEPDYGGRIDYPLDFSFIRELQISALQKAGADPLLGRKLKGLFERTGFSAIESGVYQGSWSGESSQEEIESEWKILAADLAGHLDQQHLQKLQEQDRSARALGTRLVYVPTFFTWGKVPV
jgi:ubiquinone/menaquinone biosynthesis C-methylase UbiE